MKKNILILILFVLAFNSFSQTYTGATVHLDDTVVIRLNDYVGDIQWQKTYEINNPDSWQNISDANADSLLFIADTTTYYRTKVIAGNCEPFYSDTVKVNVYNEFALYFSIESSNNKKGLFIINGNTMELYEKYETSFVPQSIQISDNYCTWYMLGNKSFAPKSSLISKNSQTGSIINEIEVDNRNMTLSKKSNIFFIYGWHKSLFVDKNTFDIIYEDSLGGISIAAFSPDNLLYYGMTNKVVEYDINDFSIVREFSVQISDYNYYVTDISFSPNGNYLYVTVYSGDSYNPGVFLSINLNTGYIEDIQDVGSESNIAVSPDGNYVYFTDPAVYFMEFHFPTNKVFRYDVNLKEIEVFINGPNDLNLTGSALYTIFAHVSPNSEYLYIFLHNTRETLNGNPVNVLKIDAVTGELVNYFTLPTEWRDFTWFWDTKLNKYSICE